jgi:archaemetzincin
MAIIYVTSVGVVEEDVLNLAEKALWHTFGHEVARLPMLAPDPAALDSRRKQWNSTLLLRQAAQARPAGALRLLALTAEDIFIPMLSFVFGQAQLGGRAALVSTARLRQEFHGFAEDRPLFSGRLIKEVVHEVGHTFGLTHCPDPSCSMSLSTTLVQTDKKSAELCPSCRLRLRDGMARPGGDVGGGEAS